MGLRISFKHPFGKKSLFHSAAKAAKFVAPLIPGVGIPLAAGIGAAGELASGGGLKGAAMGGLVGAAGGLANKAGLFKKLGKLAGPTLKSTFTTPGGGLDLQRIAGVAGATAGLVGRQQERSAAQKTLGGQNDLRNLLIKRLLESPQYNFQPTE